MFIHTDIVRMQPQEPRYCGKRGAISLCSYILILSECSHKNLVIVAKEGYTETMTTDSFSLALPGENTSDHNIYKPGFGYLIDHIPENQQRGHSTHWNEQYGESDSFEESWKPRPGPLEFIYHLAQQSSTPLIILNMGAGLGDFTTDLARIPNTFVHHVDFSKQGNDIAQEKVDSAGVSTRTEIYTGDNNEYLKNFRESGKEAGVVFLYGASGSNEPSDTEYQKTLELSAGTLKPGGYLWHVTMIQPRLIDPSDTRIQDVLGDFPKPPGMAKKILENTGLHLIREEAQERPDLHPLVPGGEPTHHIHLAYRCLFVKSYTDGTLPPTIEFDFKNAVNPQWESIWKSL